MTPIVLMGTALTLGLRHGVDWDHIAALLDISGANSGEDKVRGAMKLCLCYALGHAFVVFVLGLAAIAFAAILPTWLDAVMEKAIGITLIFLAACLFFAVYKAASDPDNFRMQSRLMMVSAFLNRVMQKFNRHGHDHKHANSLELASVTTGGAFSIGMLHGIGAETGTQVLLITAVGRTGALDLSVAMLIAFALGLVVSNSVIAWLAITGFQSSLRHRRVFMLAGSAAGIFSLWLGVLFVLGQAESLPSLCS